jgi:hypothetical protein
VTSSPFVVQTLGVDETTDVVPVSSLLVATSAVKEPFTRPESGRFEIVGVEGSTGATVVVVVGGGGGGAARLTGDDCSE